MVRSSRMTGVVAVLWCLAVLVCGPARAQTQRGSILVLPVFNGIGEDKAGMAEDLVVMLKDGLTITGKYLVLSSDPATSVSVQRAIAEQQLKVEDMTTAFKTDAQGIARAAKVCKAIGADMCVMSSLDSYAFDAGAKTVDIGLTVKIVRAASDVDATTISVKGSASGSLDDQSQTESGVAVAALDDAASKALSGILDATLVETSVPTGEGVSSGEKPRGRDKGLLQAMLAALLIGLLVGGR